MDNEDIIVRGGELGDVISWEGPDGSIRTGTIASGHYDSSFDKWLFTANDGSAIWEDEIIERVAGMGTAEPRSTSKTLRPCLSCERYFTSDKQLFRCARCSSVLNKADTFGSLIVLGQMSQRELAQLKREFYEVETLMSNLEERKAEFLRRATEQADELVRQVEEAAGAPMRELRAKRDQLREKVKEFMQESGNAKLRVRDLLLKVTEDVVNRGGVPQPTVIYEKLREIAGITEDELKAIIRSSYSEPKTAPVLHMEKLPPGRVRKQRELEEGKSGSVMLREEDGIYILSRALIKKHKLGVMIARQRTCKDSLSVSVREGDNVMVVGRFAHDPNSVRAFIADGFPGYQIVDAYMAEPGEVALEITKVAEFDAGSAIKYMSLLFEIADELTSLEAEKASIASGAITGATQMDTVDNLEDLNTKREQLPNSSRMPAGVPDSPQEGMMSPEHEPGQLGRTEVI